MRDGRESGLYLDVISAEIGLLEGGSTNLKRCWRRRPVRTRPSWRKPCESVLSGRSPLFSRCLR
ncbi:hypothetical protein NITHO_1300005 [Nitrolancea hollandica Lb]|uniref:Uncharacterized protein n=1 Tax=Nitrolancea hollandica Lb TaxID=1129897 RepID=I4ED08_9BACT|nr:hypothetical protein NITHO_1300005 [Nitrolancea hollandica Lb]